MKVIALLGCILMVLLVGAGLLTTVFASVETQYECDGRISGSADELHKVFFKLEEYRWWVIWTESKGSFSYELPRKYVGYYPHIYVAGDNLFISDGAGLLRGNFSKLSKSLSLKTPYGFFDGYCKTSH